MADSIFLLAISMTPKEAGGVIDIVTQNLSQGSACMSQSNISANSSPYPKRLYLGAHTVLLYDEKDQRSKNS
jgi:hypothetical protein